MLVEKHLTIAGNVYIQYQYKSTITIFYIETLFRRWEGETMFILVIIILAGFSLYVLLKPPTDFQNALASTDESNSELDIRSNQISETATLRVHGKFSK